VLTLFATPKPFEGEIDRIQRRAVASWCALGVQVALIGDESGTANAARELGAQHVSGLERTAHGTPRLDSAFALADGVARFPVRAFVNADIVLGEDVLAATTAVSKRVERFLLVGRSFEEGRPRGAAALDWFVFSAGLFGEMPPFAVGRAGYDNWMIWRARQSGIAVDATHDVRAVHQPHGYGHVAGGIDEAYYGEEAARNVELAGGRRRLYTLHDASHVLRDGELHRNLGAPFRWRENVRKLAWKLGGRKRQDS
jgi:hypothetical protein